MSVHHFSKIVSGAPLKRPEWFFDVRQQGEGIVDVTTHLVDLVQWEAFPGQILRPSDVKMLSARRWTTPITPAQFEKVTGAKQFPAFLARDVKDGVLNVYSNGEMNYTLKGVHARVSVTWNFEAPEGTGDTHFSVMRGTKANLVIRQGAEQKYKPVLYVERNPSVTPAAHEAALTKAVEHLQGKWPGVADAPRGRSLRHRRAGALRRRPRSALRAGDVGLPALSPRGEAARVGGAEHAGEVRHDHGGVPNESVSKGECRCTAVLGTTEVASTRTQSAGSRKAPRDHDPDRAFTTEWPNSGSVRPVPGTCYVSRTKYSCASLLHRTQRT